MSKVAEVWQERCPGIPALLFGGQLAAHHEAWTGCPCDSFWVCPGCTKTFQAGVDMAQHVKVYPGSDIAGSSSTGEEDERSSGNESSQSLL